jgi:hypothetical protein
MHAMTKIQFLLSLTLFSLTLVPAVAAEKFECPSPFKPNTPAKLEEIKGLLPNVNAMTDIGQLNVTIDTLRREGMPKNLIIDHLVGAYCPMIAREASLTESEKAALVQRFSGQVNDWSIALKVVWTLSLMYRSRLISLMLSTA